MGNGKIGKWEEWAMGRMGNEKEWEMGKWEE